MPPQSLGAMVVLLEKKPVIAKGVRSARSTADAGWILGELPHALRRILEIRNPAAHGGRVTRDQVMARRAEILGIGSEGLIVRMGRVGGGDSCAWCGYHSLGEEGLGMPVFPGPPGGSIRATSPTLSYEKRESR